jgi:flagellar protein FlaG
MNMSIDAAALRTQSLPARAAADAPASVTSRRTGTIEDKPESLPLVPVTREAVAASAQQIESYLRSVGRQLEYRIDDASGETVVTVRDVATGDLIRQIPGEEVLRLARALKDGAAALINTET